jgi:hypothetical protein
MHVKDLTTIRRKFVSPISAFTREGVSIKKKHEFLIISPGSSEQAETVPFGSAAFAGLRLSVAQSKHAYAHHAYTHARASQTSSCPN